MSCCLLCVVCHFRVTRTLIICCDLFQFWNKVHFCGTCVLVENVPSNHLTTNSNNRYHSVIHGNMYSPRLYTTIVELA